MFVLLLGVSGSGKTTVMSSVLESIPQLRLVRSCVTRPARPGEIDGERYFFWDQKIFENHIQQGDFIEYAQVHGDYYYGTMRKMVDEIIVQGYIPIKEIDIIGLEIIKKDTLYGDQIVSIFLDIDDQTMIQRITKRWELGDDELQRRVASAQYERSRARELCTHIIDASQTVAQVIDSVISSLKHPIDNLLSQ